MRVANLVIFGLLVTSCARGDESAESDPTAQQNVADERLAFIKSSIAEYDFRLGPDFKEQLTVTREPLLRFTNPVSGLQDGAFVVWRSALGRPMVGAQIFLTGDDLWVHEFQSLATVPLRGTRAGRMVWEPRRAGVEVRLVPDAPPPAAGAVQRLVQMKDIANRFSIDDQFQGNVQADKLRLLSKPLLRFGDESGDTLDGALFVHAHGTDPELMIVLEALKSDDHYRWHYSLAPMTGYALEASLDGQSTWEVPWRQPPYDPTEPFFIRVHTQQPRRRGLFDFFR